MWLQRPLDDILSSRGKVAALRVVCNAGFPLAGREIARRAGLASGHVSSILRELTASGVLSSRNQGRVNTYELAKPRSLITRRLKVLFGAEAERRHAAIERLAGEVPGLVSLILFGSEARGEAKPDSDTDLLIVVGRKTRRLEQQIDDLCLEVATEHQLDLIWMIADLRQVREWEAEGSSFWQNVQSDGVTLAGKPLEELVS